MCDIIVNATNQRADAMRGAHQSSGDPEKQRPWYPLTRGEFLAFLGRLRPQGTIPDTDGS